jgi:hypothetical protein
MNDSIKKNSQIAWGYYNLGRLIGIEYTRRGAVKSVENMTGAKWNISKKYMEVCKVMVTTVEKTKLTPEAQK